MALDCEAQFGIGKDMVIVELGKVHGIVVGMVLRNLLGMVLGNLVGMAFGIVVGMVLGNVVGMALEIGRASCRERVCT